MVVGCSGLACCSGFPSPHRFRKPLLCPPELRGQIDRRATNSSGFAAHIGCPSKAAATHTPCLPTETVGKQWPPHLPSELVHAKSVRAALGGQQVGSQASLHTFEGAPRQVSLTAQIALKMCPPET